VELYTAPPPGSTVICADELGPVIPRTFPPAPGWPPGGHRIKAPLEYSRGPGLVQMHQWRREASDPVAPSSAMRPSHGNPDSLKCPT